MSAGKYIDFETLDDSTKELIRESLAIRESAYVPYSKFKVGAALRCEDGTISRGCNVENSSYPVSTCAERAAVCRAISDGKKKFKELAVVADMIDGSISTPCGMCRQALVEFGDFTIYLTSPEMKQVFQTSSAALLPMYFHFNKHNVTKT